MRYLASLPPEGTLFGLEEPIPEERLQNMYGSREAYLREFNRQIDAMVETGWLFTDDAATLKKEAASNPPF